MKNDPAKFKTSYNPAGFIEQVFIGNQTPDSVLASVKELVKRTEKLKKQDIKILILVDVSQVPKIDISSKMARVRKEAIDGMTKADYDRLVLYGSITAQLMVSSLVLIAGKRDKIRVFGNRIDALRWLKGGA